MFVLFSLAEKEGVCLLVGWLVEGEVWYFDSFVLKYELLFIGLSLNEFSLLLLYNT